MKTTIGLIAAQGRLPMLCAEGIRNAGQRVACVHISRSHDSQLAELSDTYATAGVLRISRWIRLLHRWNATDAVLVGYVRKARMYEPFRMWRQLPDWRAGKLWYRTLRHDKRSTTMLTALADELGHEGITLIDSTQYIRNHMAHEGVMTCTQPTATQRADINFALPIVRQIRTLDVGQAVAVKDREVIAVESIEGTDQMIQRAGALCPSGKWTLVKVATPLQDMRFDVPTVGPKTIENLKAAGGTCLAVEVEKVILIDKPKFLASAERMGIAVVGVRLEEPDGTA